MTSGKATSIDEAVRALLAREKTLVLSTASDDGTPIATPLFYYSDANGNLYWLSSRESRHSVNLSVRPRVAVAVFSPAAHWKDIRGVQMEGQAEAVTDPEIMVQYRQHLALGPELDEAIASSTMYVFRPQRWRYVDSL